MLRNNVVTVDLGKIRQNYLLQKSLLPRKTEIMPVVKADAYGHGAVLVAKTLQAMGADMLAVACLSEAQELRAAGITMPILCLGQTDPAYAPELLAADVTQAVADLETGKALSAAAAWGLWLCFLALAVFPGKKAVEKPKRLRYNR